MNSSSEIQIIATFDDQAVSLTDVPPVGRVSVLVERIEAALGTIHAALTEIKRLQQPLQAPPQAPPQSKAG